MFEYYHKFKNSCEKNSDLEQNLKLLLISETFLYLRGKTITYINKMRRSFIFLTLLCIFLIEIHSMQG